MSQLFRAARVLRPLASRVGSLMGVQAPAVSAAALTHKRWLNIHEWQSQELMRERGVRVPLGKVASSPAEAKSMAEEMATGEYVVKAQVLAGGRGKGTFTNGFEGGVHLVSSVDEVESVASKMLGETLVTKQTGAEGKPCNTVYITERVDPAKEFYFAILFDRNFQGPVMVGSPHGGMNIEEVAETTPEAIFKQPIDLVNGISKKQARTMAENIGFKDIDTASQEIKRLYNLFVDTDATLLEINPFVETVDDQVMCLDAKINFDDSAFYRQKKVFEYRDVSQEDPREVRAAKYDLNYVGLEGSVGCMVNGAGLAMATLDIIKLHGGNAANFLDVGGGASTEQVMEAFEILNDDPHVKAILVNIFGGIMRCDVIAQGIMEAVERVGVNVPLIVRLEGTNSDVAAEMIRNSDLEVKMINNLDEAAKVAVDAAAE